MRKHRGDAPTSGSEVDAATYDVDAGPADSGVLRIQIPATEQKLNMNIDLSFKAASNYKDQLHVWVYDRDPATVPAGEVYAAVFLRFKPGHPPHVAQFRSRRRPDGGDDTLY